jgi:hypothetical protein
MRKIMLHNSLKKKTFFLTISIISLKNYFCKNFAKSYTAALVIIKEMCEIVTVMDAPEVAFYFRRH